MDLRQTDRQKLVFYLMDKGLSNEEIAQVLSDVAEAALEKFTNEAMTLFSEEDRRAIESAPQEDTADEMVRQLYEERSQLKADERIDELVEEQARSYMSGAKDPSGSFVPASE